LYTLDTNSIIYYLKGDAGAVAFLDEIFGSNNSIFVSSVTELELFSFEKLASAESDSIDGLLETLSIIPLDSRIARIAGLLRRTYHLKIADSVIAATALFTNTNLVTRNVRDFRKVPNLHVAKI